LARKRNHLNQIVLGLEYYIRGLKIFWKLGLAYFLLFPLAFNVLLFVLGFIAVGDLSNGLVNMVNENLKLNELEFWGAEGLGEALYWFVWLIHKIVYFFIFSILSGNIIMIFMSPVLAFLSEKVEKELTGQSYPFRLKNFIRESLRGLLVALRNMLLQIGFMILFFILGFIPLIGALVPFEIIISSSYFYGFSFLDFNNERKQVPISKSISFMRQHKALVIANGLPFTLVLLIPYVGGILASFFSILSVIAASASMTENEEF